jgi:uridylate kinase
VSAELKYQRILLKLSGESLGGEGGFGINPLQAEKVAHHVGEVREMGVDIAIVIGALLQIIWGCWQR